MHSRLKVPDDVGDLCPHGGVHLVLECAVHGRGKSDVGNRDALADQEGLGLQGGVEGAETGHGTVDNPLEGLRVVWGMSGCWRILHSEETYGLGKGDVATAGHAVGDLETGCDLRQGC